MFFPDKVALETACEMFNTCTTDMIQFKGYLHRWLSVVAQIAPFTAGKLLPVLRQSTQAAVDQCTGGTSGRQCGFFWSGGKFVAPRANGLGEELNVLSAVSSLLVAGGNTPGTASAPAGSSTGQGGGSPSGSAPGPKPSSAARHAQVGIVTVLTGLAWCIWTNV
jgi:mannan endo-1,6-alpha-mannosidase